MTKFKIVLPLLLIVTAGLIGCSKAPSEAVKVKLDFSALPPKSKVSSAGFSSKTGDVNAYYTTADIEVIRINVSGTGISQPIFWPWDNHGGAATLPPVELVVPKGPQRLIQVLVVFKTASGAMDFQYGDVMMDIAADVTAPVTVTPIGTAASGDGRLGGRYLRADGTGPTGVLAIGFAPPNGKPLMVVERTKMIGGWFEFFSLEDVNFTYILEGTKETIFNNLNLNSSELFSTTQPARTAKIEVPAYYRSDEWSGGTPTGVRELSPARKAIIGFFGPGAGTQKTCYPQTVANLEYAFTSADSANQSVIKWDGTNAATAANARVTQGGFGGTCSGTKFVDYLQVDTNSLTRHETGIDFRPPFQLQQIGTQSDKNVFSSTMSNGDLALSWKVLPGADAAIAGFGVYLRQGVPSANNGDPDYKRGDEISCDSLGSFGFGFVRDVPMPTPLPSDGAMSVTLSGITATNFSEGKVQVILCPIVASGGVSRYLGGEDYRAYSGFGGGGGGICTTNCGPMQATKIVAQTLSRTVTTAAARAVVNAQTCVPIMITGATDSGAEAYLAQGTSVTLSTPNTTDDKFFSDEHCMTGYGEANPRTFSDAFNGRIVWLKTGRTIGGSVNVDVTISANNNYPTTVFYTTMQDNAGATKIHTFAPPSITRYSCNTLVWQSQDAAGNPSMPSGFSHFFYNFPSASGLEFYDAADHDCSGMQTSGTIEFGGTGSKHNNRTVRFRYVGADPSISVAPTHGTPPLPIDAANVSVAAPGAASQLTVSLPEFLPAEDCVSVTVALRDQNWNLTPNVSGSPIGFTLTGLSGQYYTTSLCANGEEATAPDYAIATGETSRRLFFKTTVTGAQTLMVAQSPATTLQGMQHPVNVQGAMARKILIRLPGETFVDGVGMTGAPMPQRVGQPFTVELIAVTPLNHKADGTAGRQSFNETANFSGNWPASINGSTNVSFASGVATVSVYVQNGGSSTLGLSTGGGFFPMVQNSNNFQVDYDLPATQWKIYGATSIRPGCQPYLVVLEDASGLSRRANVPVSFTVANSGGVAVDEFNPSCSGGLANLNLNLASGARAQVIYINTPAGTSNTVTVSGGGYANGTITINASTGTAGSATHITYWGSTTSKVGHCTPYFAGTTEADGTSAYDGGGGGTMSLTYPAAGTFYGDQGCMSPLSGGNDPYLTGSYRSVYFFYKPSLTSPNTSLGGSLGSLIQNPLTAIAVDPEL